VTVSDQRGEFLPVDVVRVGLGFSPVDLDRIERSPFGFAIVVRDGDRARERGSDRIRELVLACIVHNLDRTTDDPYRSARLMK
jgi:hypothetical protein